MILAALLALAACANPNSGVFRDTGKPIWSAAALDPREIGGTWQQVAAFATQTGGCAAGAVDIRPVAGGLALQGALCLNGGLQRIDAVAKATGPGRLTVPGQGDWWVLWVDSGYRTLAIGTPSGAFGFVLDRGTLPADRFMAAREVFDFNGYATAAMRPL